MPRGKENWKSQAWQQAYETLDQVTEAETTEELFDDDEKKIVSPDVKARVATLMSQLTQNGDTFVWNGEDTPIMNEEVFVDGWWDNMTPEVETELDVLAEFKHALGFHPDRYYLAASPTGGSMHEVLRRGQTYYLLPM